MLLPGRLMTVVWLTSTCLCICQCSPTKDLKLSKNQEDDREVKYSAANRRHTSTDHQSYLHTHSSHHRSHAHNGHGHKNSNHSHPLKSHPSSQTLNADYVETDDLTIRPATKKPRKLHGHRQSDEVRWKDRSQFQKEDNRRRRKKTRREREREGQREIEDNSVWDNDVDDVLAALVSYSKDPGLWRFVHSVVAELDYSKKASNSSPSSAAKHKYVTDHFNPWIPKPREISDMLIKNKTQGSQSSFIDNRVDDYDRGGGGEEEEKEKNNQRNLEEDDNMTSDFKKYNFQPMETDIKPIQPPFITKISLNHTPSYPHQNTQEQLQPSVDEFETLDESPIIPNSSSPYPSSPPFPSSSSNMGIRTTHPPHFIFHKVYIDTNYDPHTRQPYHKPVLAVKAVSGDKPKVSSSNKESVSDFHDDVRERISYQTSSDNIRELPDKMEDLLIQQSHQSFMDENVNDDEEEDNQHDDTDQNHNDSEVYLDSVNASMETEMNPLYERDNQAHFLLHRELQRDWSGDDDIAMEDISFDDHGWKEVTKGPHHRRHFLQRLRKLHSFKSQLKFLRRWQERLVRKRSQWSSYYKPSMT